MKTISTQKNPEIKVRSSWKPWVIASVAAMVIFTVALGFMDVLGLFEIPADDTGAKTIAAALALVGSVFATVATLVGTVIKYSIDDRNAQFAAVESHRAHALAIEAEHRNRIDAAIRAVNLLGENNKDATTHQIGGAILALTSLGELELAVSLLADLWPSGRVSNTVASSVLDKAMKSSAHEVTIAAAGVILENAELIDQQGTHLWPIDSLGWNVDLPLDARNALAHAAMKWMKVELSRDQNNVPIALVVLFKALKDPDINIRDIAAASLRPIAEEFPHNYWVQGKEGKLFIADVVKCLADLPAEPISNFGQDAALMIQEALRYPASESEHEVLENGLTKRFTPTWLAFGRSLRKSLRL